MSFDLKVFESQLPAFIPQLLDEVQRFGFVPIVVGGVVRDFHLSGKLGHDWDIEISSQTLSFELRHWKDFGKALSVFGKMSFLPYEIIRVQTPTHQLEFSPPRVEHYRTSDKAHSNFDAEYILNLPFEEAVKRRDFTINAMGVRFLSKRELLFLDPLEGVRHLHEKVLHYCGPDFPKDPVRFLRAHRFANKLKFKFSSELKALLDCMPLSGVTPSYVWSETQKAADPVNFLSYLVQEKNSELNIPLDKAFTDKVPEIKNILKDPRRFENWVIALEWVDLSSEAWSKYFSISTETSRRLARWTRSSKEFQKVLPEDFQGEFEDVLSHPRFETLFDWYFTTKQLLQKNASLPLLVMIEELLPEWIHLYRFEPPKDVKHIDPPLRAKYQVWNLCQRI